MAQTRVVTDQLGKTVEIPETPQRIYALSPPDTLLVYAVAPCLLNGWNYQPNKAVLPLLVPCTRGLPVLGGFFGQAKTPNKEAVVKANPDLVVSGTMAQPYAAAESFFQSLNAPVIHVNSRNIEDYPGALRFLGDVLGQKKRGETLAAYAEKVLDDVRVGLTSIPEDKRLTVYYAEGRDGLYTDGRESFHAYLLNLAGGVNVHTTPQTKRYGRDRVTMERVLGYAPQAIVVQDAGCRDMILSSPLWRDIPAVQTGRVYLLPDKPFGWFDRPPSFMRILCLKWLAQSLYPDVFHYDMIKETQEFFKLFLQKELSPAEAQSILTRGGGNLPMRQARS
ncbi:ABC transporter substrate-binding protein [Desulfovibrio inopinatus]|uniref:ABC transporter substrate-binding protein n=1 Tax=Desulfovibrio inopinatus TaxID=102109 RepID=UPI001FE1B4F8|nr:ABC transporter substrate-binding protein [Desulfovibrio inopinatus]